KKPRANPDKYRWAASAKTLKATIRPEVQRTAELLCEYVSTRSCCRKSRSPQLHHCACVPKTEWNNLLLRKPVNFDVLLSGWYSSKLDDKHVEQVREVKLSYSNREPTKKVTTVHEWIIAFKSFQAAMVFTFPHRVNKLSTYRLHVYQFKTHNPIFALCITEYDCTVRKKVTQNRSLLLSDLFKFLPLQVQYIGLTGANIVTSTAKASLSSGGERAAEVCNCFNNRICPNLASQCRYRHVCSGCNFSGHVQSSCTKTTKCDT
ncbi:hypothetical protein C8T65DRAFT_588710, partial [Cerioporus squamosus]